MANPLLKTRQIADLQVTNGKLASDVARSNLLTNGGFEIWQRGNGPHITAYCADRWYLSGAGTDTLSVSRDATNMDSGSQACAAVTFTKGNGTGSALFQYVNDEAVQLAGRTVSFSVRVRTATANAARIRFWDGVTLTNGTYHTGGGAYQTLTLTVAVAANATQLGMGVQFDVSCTAYIDNAMLVVGSVPADYAPLHPADDLARCLRYYEIVGRDNSASIVVQGYDPAAGSTFRQGIRFQVPKAVNPTVTKVGTWATSNTGQPSLGAANNPDGFLLIAVSSGAGQGLTYNQNAGTYITAEANP